MAWTRINMRLPEELDAAAAREAERLGLNKSEYVRQWIAIGIATARIRRALEQGMDPKDLDDPERVARVLSGLGE